jgi:hypothetical protein
VERFEVYNQLIDAIKSVTTAVEAYSEADAMKDLRVRELAADALRYRVAQLASMATSVESDFEVPTESLSTLESDIAPKHINQINEKLEPLRKALLSEILRLSIDI